MPIIAGLKEVVDNECRCAILPANVRRYLNLGLEVLVESGIGERIGLDDREYTEAGAQLVSRSAILQSANVIVSVRPLPVSELSAVRAAILLSFLDPFNHPEYVEHLCQFNITALSMEMIPRISRSQKMDALSSQASLAGYVMAIKAATLFNRVLPMMMTPAGTLKPAKVFVIGAGVAGLQAIATAKRLGAVVTAFDTRAVVAEQVASLGAKFLEIDLGETGQTEQGYAVSLTPEQMASQQDAQLACIAESDIVITTAQLFGRRPPVLIKRDAIKNMQPGSVIVDMAAESGGNVEGSIAGKVVTIDGVHVMGTGNWANEVARDAAHMYGNNVLNFVTEFWQQDQGVFRLDPQDEIIQGAMITNQGQVTNLLLQQHYANEGGAS